MREIGPVREPGDWIENGWTIVQSGVFIVMVGSCIFWTGWFWYAGTGAAFYVVLSVLFGTRWRGSPGLEKKRYSMCIGWPVSIVMLPKTVRDEERLRKLRIIREVMET